MEYSIDELILTGAIEVAGVHENTGEILYNITDKIQEVLPVLYGKFIDQIHTKVMYFWEQGFLEFDDMTKVNPNIRLTPKAWNDDELLKLPKEKLMDLEMLLTAFRIN